MGCIYTGPNYIKRQSDSDNFLTFWYTLGTMLLFTYINEWIFLYIYTIISIRTPKICIPTLIFKSIHQADLPMYVRCPPPSLIFYSCRRRSNFELPCSAFFLLVIQFLKSAVNLSFSEKSVSCVKRLQPFLVFVVSLSYKICMICLCVWATS